MHGRRRSARWLSSLAAEIRWPGRSVVTGLAIGMAGLALTVAGVSLGLTIYQLRSQRDGDNPDP
jgi:hypothetical protein